MQPLAVARQVPVSLVSINPCISAVPCLQSLDALLSKADTMASIAVALCIGVRA